MLFIHAGVVLSLVQPVVNVSEGIGSTEICAMLNGTTARNVTAMLTTVNDTAQGKRTGYDMVMTKKL